MREGGMRMKEARQKQMLAYIAERGSCTMEQLRERFGMSMNTVRSDVAALAATGAIGKTYGGVRILRAQEVPLFTQRSEQYADAKRRIARFAEARIEDGDTLYIDSGTTTMHLIDYLSPAKHVKIITPNLTVILRAAVCPNVELTLLPGVLNRRTNAVADVSTLEYLQRYRCDKAFVGATGVSAAGKLNVSTYIEYEMKKVVLTQSRRVFLLVDSSKFGRESLMTYGALSSVTELITDEGCPASARELCHREGVPCTVAF